MAGFGGEKSTVSRWVISQSNLAVRLPRTPGYNTAQPAGIQHARRQFPKISAIHGIDRRLASDVHRQIRVSFPAGPATSAQRWGPARPLESPPFLVYNNSYRQFHDRTCFTIERRKVVDKFGRVAEWLMAADCKSAAPCGLRRFESSPVHQQSRIDFRFVC